MGQIPVNEQIYDKLYKLKADARKIRGKTITWDKLLTILYNVGTNDQEKLTKEMKNIQ